MSTARGCFSWGLKNEFEMVVVNEPSVFEPLKFYGRFKYSPETYIFKKSQNNRSPGRDEKGVGRLGRSLI